MTLGQLALLDRATFEMRQGRHRPAESIEDRLVRAARMFA